MSRRVVLVTGGTRGIGRAIAEGLCHEGHAVALCARARDEVDDTVAQLRRIDGAEVLGFAADVSQPEAVAAMLTGISAAWRDVEGLVNNAAVAGPVGPLEACPLDAWEAVLRGNLLGAVICARAVLPGMKARRDGVIVNICGAGVGWRGEAAGQSAYRTSKFAVYGFTESLASEVRDWNVRVNAISPGSVDTGLRDRLAPGGVEATPGAADLSAEPTVAMARFLLSPRSGGLTGKLVSARWDDPDHLGRDWRALNDSDDLTLRKIDGRNYVPG